MDTLSHHYLTSIFVNLEETFWNPAKSWKNKYELPDWIPDAFTDAWHIFKFLMIVSIIFAIVLFKPNEYISIWWIDQSINYLILGIVWNLVFMLFYDKLLVKE